MMIIWKNMNLIGRRRRKKKEEIKEKLRRGRGGEEGSLIPGATATREGMMMRVNH